MNEWSIFIPCIPLSWKRPKLRPKATRQGKLWYDPNKEFKDFLQKELWVAWKNAGHKLISNLPITILELIFILDTPKSWRKLGKVERSPHITTPDRDNLEKIICEALQGVVVENDSQINLSLVILKGYVGSYFEQLPTGDVLLGEFTIKLSDCPLVETPGIYLRIGWVPPPSEGNLKGTS